jgi:hypothetical protein
MLKNELRLRERAYRNGWLRERKLHLIWRTIARRRQCALTLHIANHYHEHDGGQ